LTFAYSKYSPTESFVRAVFTLAMQSSLIADKKAPAMHIAISTVGSRGDVQPFVALAIGLQQAGHRVTLVTSHTFTCWFCKLWYTGIRDQVWSRTDRPVRRGAKNRRGQQWIGSPG
jgi:hypothetical protein